MALELTHSQRKLLIVVSSLISLALGLWIIFSPYGALKYFQLKKEIRAVQKESAEIELASAALVEEIGRLEKDPVYLEEMARREFGLIKKNEVIYQFQKPTPKKKH